MPLALKRINFQISTHNFIDAGWGGVNFSEHSSFLFFPLKQSLIWLDQSCGISHCHFDLLPFHPYGATHLEKTLTPRNRTPQWTAGNTWFYCYKNGRNAILMTKLTKPLLSTQYDLVEVKAAITVSLDNQRSDAAALYNQIYLFNHFQINSYTPTQEHLRRCEQNHTTPQPKNGGSLVLLPPATTLTTPQIFVCCLICINTSCC